MSSSEKIAYLAGLFDGEGWISIYWAGTHFRSQAGICNTNKSIIAHVEKILRSLKLQYCLDTRHWNKYNWSSYQRITFDGRKRIKALLSIILPYLVGKKEQAELILKYCNSGFREIRNREIDCFAIAAQIKKLNHLRNKS